MKKKKKTSKRKVDFSQEWKNIIFNIIFSIVAISIVIIFYERIVLTAILEGVLGIIGLIKWRSKVTLSIYVLGGVWLTLVVGLVVVLNHNVWVRGWPVVITIYGWGGILKGIWMLVFPNSAAKFTQAYSKTRLFCWRIQL